jgi:uncharacterized membrane protein YgcG
MLMGGALAQEVNFPAYLGYVNDYASVIDSQTRAQLIAVSSDLEKITGVQLVLATVNTTAPLQPKAYAEGLLEKWEVGRSGKYYGLVVVISILEKRAVPAVGYGLKEVISQDRAEQIVDYEMLSPLTRGDFSGAALAGVSALAKRIKDQYYGIREEEKKGYSLVPYLLVVIALTIVFSLVLRSEVLNLLGGILGAVAGFFYIQTIWGVILGAVIGFIAGYLGLVRKWLVRGGWVGEEKPEGGKKK